MLKEAQKPSEKALSLIQLVGTQVRAARTGVGFSRRELAERSGVSMRYLAQLEGGEGNISIGLLQQVATALELPIEALITETTSQTAELRHVTALYQKADVATRARASGAGSYMRT
jgi:XRE family aerobic/anaerobic benzoate catabolism transcriptional regulator